MTYCLIGKKLKHSFSKEIHEQCGVCYELVELSEEKVGEFVKNNNFNGFNVTIPYKKIVMSFLDEIDESALNTGAVNTVVKKSDKLYGYNTDVFGIEYAFKKMGVNVGGKNVLVLGSGGAGNSAVTACKNLNAKSVVTVSRGGEVNYQNVYEYIDTEIIINSTPVGMYPDVNGCPIELDKFDKLEAVFDCVYNPLKTRLILKAEELEIKCGGGLIMLVAQALKAQELWGVGTFTDSKVNEILKSLVKERKNIVLTGMPSSGKSSIAKLLAKSLNKEIIDTDTLIENRTGKKISEIFSQNGEQVFRQIESEVVKEVSVKNGLIIATGGGSVLSKANRDNLKSNGKVYYIKRDIEKLSTNGRPLSQSKGVEKIYNERKQIYQDFADVVVDNNGQIECEVEEILNNENIDN